MQSAENSSVNFFKFEDLRVYHKSLDYLSWVYSKINNFPDERIVSSARQFLDAAQAIPLHIAEGSARNKSQFIYFLKMAKSSVRECVVHTTLADRMEFLTAAETEESLGVLEELTRMLGALIGSLQRSNMTTDNEYE